MSQFINTKDTIVTNALEGVLKASGGKIAQLDGFPHIKVLVRTDWDKAKVALVSGGGSGHEPAHAGFVGEGLLTAAVCGDIFASPSVDAVLAGILAVTGDAGCLLIVTNYTGDRLNFGFAAERARTLGLKVSMVVVDDDIALPELAQARGVAGTLFVHKIAGALAEQGADLDAVTATAQRVIEGAATIGMSLDTCTVPGSPKEQRIDSGKAELGLGIHGEPGVEQVEFTSARGAISMVVDKLSHVMSDAPHVALLNNLGGTTTVEMSILANELASSSIAGRLKWIIGPAALMTSLDMRGFSLSILPVDSVEMEQALQAPVGPSIWPGMNSIVAPIVLALPDGLSTPKATPSKNSDRRALIHECCELMMSTEAKLNALDAKSGDGDTGSTVAVAALALLNSLDDLPLADMTQLYRAIGTELSQKMGGSSGVLLAIFFTAAGDASASGHDVVASLTAGMERIKQVGGASIGDRTMIDALAPALTALPDGLKAASVAARKGANHTSEIIHAKAGRASYVSPDMLAGNNDPGAEAVALLLEHLAK